MRLLYTPETPDNYQPPNFQDCTGSPVASSILSSTDDDVDIQSITQNAALGSLK